MNFLFKIKSIACVKAITGKLDLDRFTVRLLDSSLGPGGAKSVMRSLQNGGEKSCKRSELPSPHEKRVRGLSDYLLRL